MLLALVHDERVLGETLRESFRVARLMGEEASDGRGQFGWRLHRLSLRNRFRRRKARRGYANVIQLLGEAEERRDPGLAATGRDHGEAKPGADQGAGGAAAGLRAFSIEVGCWRALKDICSKSCSIVSRTAIRGHDTQEILADVLSRRDCLTILQLVMAMLQRRSWLLVGGLLVAFAGSFVMVGCSESGMQTADVTPIGSAGMAQGAAGREGLPSAGDSSAAGAGGAGRAATGASGMAPARSGAAAASGNAAAGAGSGPAGGGSGARAGSNAGAGGAGRAASGSGGTGPTAAMGGSAAAGTGAPGTDCPHSGHISYTIAKAPNPTATEQAAYDKIKAAMDKALSYYNCYADITKNIQASYVPSVQTADGNINGSLRFGSNTMYMDYRTCMHEISHTVGIGQASNWSSMISNGLFTGSNANAQLKAINDALAMPGDGKLHADAQHFWPYGINQQSEVKSEADLIAHCQMVVAIRMDLGLK